MARRSTGATLLVGLMLVAAGCEDREAARQPSPEPPDAKQPGAVVEGKRVAMGENVWLEIMPNGSRRVVVEAEVCLREGPLEQFLTRKGRKEHEAILAADVDARKVHNALLVAGAKQGTPVRFDPKFQPATGTRIRVWVVYEKDGRKVQANARSWVRGLTTRQELESDWVFAGSVLASSPLDPTAPKVYLANDGDVICLANFESALLDVPFESSQDKDRAGYEAWTERIPAQNSRVTVILEPVVKK